MDENSSVVFKATNNGLILIMKDEDDFEKTYDQIGKKLAAAGKFFKGASLVVKYRGKKLSSDEEEKICNLMSDKTEARIIAFEEDTNYEPNADLNVLENSFNIEENNKPASYIKKFFFKGIEEGITKFYRGTVRSGQLLNFNGNVVILGDVNPGAEVQATGNIIIMGTLRGTVHAGMDGNKEAIIAALSFQPVQLRIASVITRPPDDVEDKGSMVPEVTYIPEIAYIKEDMVYIERLLPQR